MYTVLANNCFHGTLFQEASPPEKAFTEKIARGLRRGRSPISRKSVHGKPFQGLTPPKSFYGKMGIKFLNRIVFSGCPQTKSRGLGRGCPHPGTPLGRELGAIAPVGRGVEPHPGEAMGVGRGAMPHPGK
jgi:hypothetical protein